MATDTLPQKIMAPARHLVCPKCNYSGKFIVEHEDGWQCWNCMKIIYKNPPIVDLDTEN